MAISELSRLNLKYCQSSVEETIFLNFVRSEEFFRICQLRLEFQLAKLKHREKTEFRISELFAGHQ